MQIDRPAIAEFALKSLVAIALIALALLIWHLRDAALLLFAAIVVAVILRGSAEGLQRVLPIGDNLALAVATGLITIVVAGVFILFGQQMAIQFSDLAEALPGAWSNLVDQIGADRVDGMVERFAPQGSTIAGVVQSALSIVTSVATGLVLAVLGGLYLAANPATYRAGALRLLPDDARERTARALDATGQSLRSWLLGQMVLMAVVGVVTAVGLTLIGVPSALALGLIAGLLEFVPLVGPIVAAIPGVLIAMTMGVETAAITAGFYLIIQQAEGNVMEPLIMRKSVSIPPAVTLFSIFLFGGLFGPVGVLLGGPLTVAAFVLVRVLWLNDDMQRSSA
ncbi:AI-2E family transporter [Sphingomonas mucosissima]|uniref:AI-2 transport protein TqsA n=1 Tax=Sphingomonas mucosissima TaxID=370959 RepID=A0A245ZQF5_9SPHN|nr:AI-2E family transporter [Sphingomonas mucosissima]OWK31982.1 AI-2 transport protein TqsA [Sphingomonas mucosissima]